MVASTINPQVSPGGSYSPLDSLMVSALRRWGDSSASAVHPSIEAMFIEFANLVIDDLRIHPYWEDEIDYYTHSSEVRAIPDAIMVAGLLAYYASQQGSAKTQLYVPSYRQRMNQVLYQRLYGNEAIDLNTFDKSDDGTYGPTSDEASS